MHVFHRVLPPSSCSHTWSPEMLPVRRRAVSALHLKIGYQEDVSARCPDARPRLSVFLDGLVTFVVLKNVGPESGHLLSLAVVADVAHEDVVPIIERLRKFA